MLMIATIDPVLIRGLRRILEERGESFLILKEGANIVQSVIKQNPSLLILDLYLTNPSGIEILRQLRILGFPGKVVVLGGQSVQTLAPEACRLGAFQIVGRPFNPNQILCAARVASGALDHDPVPI